jgi:uncharacterized protein YndB with AHSA1/START domain
MTALRHSVTVPVHPDLAFEVFTGGFGRWWPAERTWSGPGALIQIGIEAGAGGLCYEIGPHGFRCDWGRVLAFDPPRRLVLSWQIGPHGEPVPDPERAGEVEVSFAEADELGTVVTVEHRAFERYGPDGDSYRKQLDEPDGWPYLLSRFRQAVSTP